MFHRCSSHHKRQDRQVVRKTVAGFGCENSFVYPSSTTCSALNAYIFLIFLRPWTFFFLLVSLKESQIEFLALKSKGTVNNHDVASD
jgi:hypothetical protein